MGRPSTGAWTTNECLRIELSYLLSHNLIQKDRGLTSTLSWNDEDETTIQYNSYHSPGEKYIQLKYEAYSYYHEEYRNYEYQVTLTTVPSNLGQGEVLYFYCPYGGTRCRILYRAYGSPVWMSRQAYDSSIYYPAQVASKKQYAASRYWTLSDRTDRLYALKTKEVYQGKPTRLNVRLDRLERELEYYDTVRGLRLLGRLHIY